MNSQVLESDSWGSAFGPKPRRLSEIGSSLLPFRRALSLDDISLYWLPVARFPVPESQREWILDFYLRLDQEMQRRDLRVETFLQFKSLYPDLLKPFLKTTNQYQPITGVSIVYGELPPEPPTFEEIQRTVEKGGMVDVNQWMADYCHWFLVKKPQEQRRNFFGHGGVFSLYLKSDPSVTPPKVEIPRIVRTHPMFEKMEVEAKISAAYGLSDGFLKKSHEMFGEPFRDDPSFEGILFVIPLLFSRHFLDVSTSERQRWFELFDAYMIESPTDKGVLLAVNDPNFDEALESILNAMREEKFYYQCS